MAKSMRGINIDLGKLMARQEKNITVGNTKSNARGDQLGKGGRIVKSADELAREHYNRNDPKPQQNLLPLKQTQSQRQLGTKILG